MPNKGNLQTLHKSEWAEYTHVIKRMDMLVNNPTPFYIHKKSWSAKIKDKLKLARNKWKNSMTLK